MQQLSPEELRELARLVETALDGARLIRATALGVDAARQTRTLKSAGYGAPVRLDVEHRGRQRSLVLHTATPNEFGHDRRSDRAAEMLLAADTFDLVPLHTQVIDVGAYGAQGGFVSLRETGEFYLLTTWSEGSPYAESLRALGARGRAEPRDVERAERLALYLAELHATRLDNPVSYARSLRDLVGSGEGILGIADSYPGDVPAAPPERLERIEQACLREKNRIRPKAERLRRIHGDFHPFNILFDEQDALSLLDTSRGSEGDPADDLTALSVNYLFFALEHPGSWHAGFRPLWQAFFQRYLERTGDAELGGVMAPFFAWRALVLACPKWYPGARVETRERLLGFVEALLAGERFEPALADRLFTP